MIKNKEFWDTWVKNNQDPYGRCCVNVARRVMEILDEDSTPLHAGYFPDLNTPHGIICKADEDVQAGGITGAMAGAVCAMVVSCHSRGDEFKSMYGG